MEKHLRHLLDEISSAIGRSKHHEEREQLTRLHEEVQRGLTAKEAPEQRSGLVEALERAEIDLEAEHPRLAAALRQAVNALSSAGI